MIKAFLYSLIALGIGAWLYMTLGDDPGYVLLSFGNWSVETTLVALVLFLFLMLIVLYGPYRLAGFLNPLGLFRGEALFGSGRRRKHAARASEEGLRLMLLGHWQDAYKMLVENAESTDSPVFNYLAAALAAWQRGDNASWKFCLEKATRQASKTGSGIKAVKALLEYRSGNVEQSLALLLALDREVPGSPYVLNMLKEIYLNLQDWEKLDALLPVLEKYRVVSSTELQQLREKTTAQRLLGVTKEKGGAQALSLIWQDVDKKLRRSERVALVYLKKLIGFANHDEALTVATKYLKHEWSDDIVLQTGFIDTSEPARLLVLLEKWLKARPNSSALMLSLGRVCLRNRRWSQAREYFESAGRLSNNTALTAEANAELARLLDHQGEHAQSAALYAKAMAQLDHQLPDLPQP